MNDFWSIVGIKSDFEFDKNHEFNFLPYPMQSFNFWGTQFLNTQAFLLLIFEYIVYIF